MHSPASGVRRQSPHDALAGGSVPMLLRTSMAARSGMRNLFAAGSKKPPNVQKARYYRKMALAGSYLSIPSTTPTP